MQATRVRTATIEEQLAMARGSNNLGNFFVEQQRAVPLHKSYRIVSTHATMEAANVALVKLNKKLAKSAK